MRILGIIGMMLYLNHCGNMSKKSQEKYRAAGLCILCGKVPPRKDRVSCEACSKRQLENDKRKKDNYILNGKCSKCGERDLVTKRHCEICKEKHYAISRKNWRLYREEVYNAYGNVCACCGESEPAFLSIDHIDNDGASHRKKIGAQIYRFLIKNNFPKNFQILCMNCQWGRKNCNGICPHQKIKRVNSCRNQHH